LLTMITRTRATQNKNRNKAKEPKRTF